MSRYNGNIMVYYEYDDPFIGRIGDFLPVQGMRDWQYYPYSGQGAWHNLGTENATSAWEPRTSTDANKGIYLKIYRNGAWHRITQYQVRTDTHVEFVGNRITLLPANGYNFGKNYKVTLRLEPFHIPRGVTTNQNIFYTGEGTPEQLSNYYFRVYYNASSSRIVLDRKIGSEQYTLTIPYTLTQGTMYALKLASNIDGDTTVKLDTWTWDGSTWSSHTEYNNMWNPWGSDYSYTSSTTNAYLGDTYIRFDVLCQVSGANYNDTDRGGSMGFNKNGWPSGDFVNQNAGGGIIALGSNVTDNSTFSGLGNYSYTESTYTWR